MTKPQTPRREYTSVFCSIHAGQGCSIQKCAGQIQPLKRMNTTPCRVKQSYSLLGASSNLAVNPWTRRCLCHRSARPPSPAASGAWYPGSLWRSARTSSHGRTSAQAQVCFTQKVKFNLCLNFVFLSDSSDELIFELLPWSICHTGEGVWSSLSRPGPASPVRYEPSQRNEP